jgi:hypothetical protein
MAKRFVLALSALLLTGCATGHTPGTATDPATSAAPPGSSTSATTPAPKPKLMPDETLPPRTSQPASNDTTTIVGVVEEGVEHGCKLLRTSNGLYLLVGSNDPMITAGARLSVRGRLNPSLVTTCQQGTAFQVSHVQPA